MATLLCSMLTGAGFAAVVVSGSATIETTLNDQRRVECPFIPNELSSCDEPSVPITTNKYELKGPPDLRSKFLVEVASKAAQKELDDKERLKRVERERAEELARRPCDKFHGRRMHAWVAVIENAPWCYKPRQKVLDDQGNEVTPSPKAFFIEPSTGFRHEVTSPNYLRIESIWNQHNYYINRQLPSKNGLANMEWDLANNDHWEHFLPAEPYELRSEQSVAQHLEEAKQDIISLEKHLDIISSWVQKLHISLKNFSTRFPNEKKEIFYQKAFYERFAAYHNADGLVKKLTIYDDFHYKKPTIRWEWYENRLDQLDMIKIDFQTRQIKENFLKGRRDCLKFFAHNAEPNRPKTFQFFHQPRLDCLKTLELATDRYTYHFEDREDLCYYQEFQIKPKDRQRSYGKSLMEISEKFHRNESLPVAKDIAVRKFHLSEGKIFLQFQYGNDAITASTREFTKPPKADYGEEIIFDPSLTSGYIANPLEVPPTQAELYFQLLDQLKREEELKKLFEKRSAELEELLTTRKEEMLNPRLKFSIFDPLRNEGARKIRLQQYEEEQLRKELVMLEEPDFLAPYLVGYENRKPNYEESWNAYNACLSDVKARYSNLLNELQRRYEDLTTEAQALKKFLNRFQEQFNNLDYDRLIKEAKDIEFNRHMVQQRLILTHEEAQRKYEKIETSLQVDGRLCLTK